MDMYDSSKSTYGYIYTIDGLTMSWMSKLQNYVALSSTETKYVAIVEAEKKMIRRTNYLKELGKKQCRRFFIQIIIVSYKW